ncbi:hypothetical protein DERP_014366, partial [Dermatophagoides pteronyssinus]
FIIISINIINIYVISSSSSSSSSSTKATSLSAKIFQQQQQNFQSIHQHQQPHQFVNYQQQQQQQSNHNIQHHNHNHNHHHHHHLRHNHLHYTNHITSNIIDCNCLSPSTTTTTTTMTTEMTAASIAIESMMESDLILQALNGFLLILTCDGEVFYTSNTVETYLGFHQSDICHQSVYELVHSEDREELQRHLMWNSNLPTDRSTLKLSEILLTGLFENCHLLERNFTVRFRCLLDNTSGFLRLDVRGRIKILHGQNHKSEEPPMALFAVCTPFGPPSLLEMPANEKASFKSKHKLDFSMVSMEPRGRSLLGYNESDLANRGGYDLIHQDDLFYVASAHQECKMLKTGASVLIAYRLVSKDCLKWQWLQTSARLVYKNSKPDFILCTHRPLMEEEGRDLLSKRTMDFKVTYLDGGLGAITVNRNSNGGSQQNSCNFLNDSYSQSSSSGNTPTTTKTTTNDCSTVKQSKSIKSERSTSRSSSRNTNSVNSVCDVNGNGNSNNGSHSINKCNNDINTNTNKLRYQAADSTSGSSHSDSQSQSHNQRNTSRSNNNNTQSYMTTTTTTTKKSSKSSSLKSGASSSSSSSAKKNKSSAANISSCMSRYESPNSFSMTSNHTNSISSQHYLSTPPLETNNSFDRNIQHNLKLTGDREIHFDSAITSINHSNSTTSPEISDLSSANIRSTTSNYTNSSGSWSSAIHHHSNPYSALLDESGSLHLASEAPSHSMFGHQHTTATSAYHHHSGHPHSLSIGGLDCGTAAAAAAVAAAAYNAAYHHPATASTHQPYSHHQTITSHNNDSLTQSSPPPPLHQHRQQTHHPEAIVHDSIDTDSSQPNYSGSVSSASNIVLPSSSESPSSTDVSVSVTTSNDIEHNNLLSRAPTTSFFSAENLLNYSSATRPHNPTNSYGAANTCSSTSDTTGNDIYAVAAAAAIHHGQRHGQYVMGGHSANSHHPYTHHHYGTAASTYHHQLHQNSGIATSSHPHHTSYNHDNFNHDDNGSTNLSGGYLRNPVTGLMYSETFSDGQTSSSTTNVVHLNHNSMISADTPPASSSSSSSSSSTTLIDEYNNLNNTNNNDDRKQLRSTDLIIEHNNNNSQPNPLLWNSLMASTTNSLTTMRT